MQEAFFFFNLRNIFFSQRLIGSVPLAPSALVAFSFCVTACVPFVLFLLILEGFMNIYDSAGYVFLLVLRKIEFEVVVFIFSSYILG